MDRDTGRSRHVRRGNVQRDFLLIRGRTEDRKIDINVEKMGGVLLLDRRRNIFIQREMKY
jgi:hypothetical protein